MEEIQMFLDLNWTNIILSIFIIMSTIITVFTIIGKFSEIIGKPVKWIRSNQKDHKLIIENAKAIQELSRCHKEDTRQSIRHDEIIRNDLKQVSETVNKIVKELETMQEKSDTIEMAKLKEKILAYYRKYSLIGEWEKFESDVFWGLFDNYVSRGGNSFVKDDIEPIMRSLKIKD